MDNISLRKNVSFSRAERGEFTPKILSPGYLSDEFKSLIWREIYNFMDQQKDLRNGYYYVNKQFFDLLKSILVEYFFTPIDEIKPRFNWVLETVKEIIYSENHVNVLEFVQAFLRHGYVSDKFRKNIDDIFKKSYVGYRLLEGNTVIPYVNDDELSGLSKNIRMIEETDKDYLKFHLRSSADFMNKGLWSSSVRESISAVESVIKAEYPGREFSEAMTQFQRETGIHGALKKAMIQMYGYASDEQGIRHALFDKDAPNVDSSDAVYMYSVCISFISYVIRKKTKVFQDTPRP